MVAVILESVYTIQALISNSRDILHSSRLRFISRNVESDKAALLLGHENNTGSVYLYRRFHFGHSGVKVGRNGSDQIGNRSWKR